MPTFQVTQLSLTPDMINLGIGQPSPSLLPLQVMRQAAYRRLGQKDAQLLAYGAEQGDGYFRHTLAGFLSEMYGTPVSADHLFITAGASQGLDLLCSLFTKTGDTIFVEEPSYFLALRIFADHGLKIVSIPLDQDGLEIEALEIALQQHQPAFLYTIPTFHNPTGVTLSAIRRQQLVELSRRYNFLIVADEVYQMLAYTVTPPLPLASFVPDAQMVVSLGSFSKILAPGLRLGWIQAAPPLMERLAGCGLCDSGGGLNPFTSALVSSAIEQGLQQQHLSFLRGVYQRRAAVLSAALHHHLPDVAAFAEPEGGFFIWIALAEDVDTVSLQTSAQAENVSFQPGANSSSQQGLKNFIRLSFAYYDAADLEQGVQRLARVLLSSQRSVSSKL